MFNLFTGVVVDSFTQQKLKLGNFFIKQKINILLFYYYFF